MAFNTTFNTTSQNEVDANSTKMLWNSLKYLQCLLVARFPIKQIFKNEILFFASFYLHQSFGGGGSIRLTPTDLLKMRSNICYLAFLLLLLLLDFWLQNMYTQWREQLLSDLGFRKCDRTIPVFWCWVPTWMRDTVSLSQKIGRMT